MEGTSRSCSASTEAPAFIPRRRSADNQEVEYLLLICALLGSWAFLSLLGSERDRRSRQLDYQIARANAQATLAAHLAAESARRQQAIQQQTQPEY